ncbi:MAG: glycosyltransferase family 4 protein [Chloroflexota bacterium]
MLLDTSSGSVLFWLLPVLAGCAGGLALTPLTRLVALRTGTIDRPIGQKIHKYATPLLGGVAVYVAFALVAIVFLPLTGPVVGVLAGGLAAIVVGVLDERLDLPPLIHLGGQTLAALIAIVSGVGVLRTISIPTATLSTPGFSLPLGIGLVVTLIWLVGMMNTVNFLDGMDGLAAGIATIAAVLLAVWASEKHLVGLVDSTHHQDLILPAILAGALVGFLPYNWHRARIFLGDSGSMFLGMALGTISIIGPTKLGTALLVLLIPVVDVAWAIVRRRVQGRSSVLGDKKHFYHRMLNLGMSHTTVVLLLYVLVGGIALLDLELRKLDKLIAFVLLASAVGLAFILLETRSLHREEAERLQTAGANSNSLGGATTRSGEPADGQEDHDRVDVSR